MSLRASEAVIYGRYGFGVAGEYTEAAIDTAARPPRVRRRLGRQRSGCCDPTRSTTPCARSTTAPPTAGPASSAVPTRGGSVTSATRSAGTKSSYVVVHVDGHGRPTATPTTTWRGTTTGAPGGKGEVHDVFGDRRRRRARPVGVPRRHRPGPHVEGRRAPARRRPARRRRRPAAPTRPSRSTTSNGCASSTSTPRCRRARTTPPTVEVTIAVTDPLVDRNNGVVDGRRRRRQRTHDAGRPGRRHQSRSRPPTSAGRRGTRWPRSATVEVRNEKALAIADNLFASRPLPFSGSFF